MSELIAAIIAAIVAWAGAYALQARKKTTERRNLLRQKAEELCRLCCVIVRWADDRMGQFMPMVQGHGDPKIYGTNPPLDELETTVELYHPHMIPNVENFKRSIKNYRSKEAILLFGIVEKGAEAMDPGQKLYLEVTIAHEDLVSTRDDFVRLLGGTVRELM